jgi:hypothetical protein
VVASAVLVSAGHVLQWNAEIVKRWSNEIQEAVQSKNGMVQVSHETWACQELSVAVSSRVPGSAAGTMSCRPAAGTDQLDQACGARAPIVQRGS